MDATALQGGGDLVRGDCRAGFAAVRDAFAGNLASGFEVGAALAVFVDGEPVVDLWGGHADAARTRPWERDTLVNLYSVGKGVTAICALRLVEDGLLDLEAPVARYWPEFAQADKGRLPVKYLLTHQAGLPAIAQPLPADAWRHWNAMTAALAAQAPWWEPGSGHGYHVNMQGFLVGEVLRRITGQSLGTYLRERIGGPAGVDFFIGLPAELEPRCADVLPPPPGAEGELGRLLAVKAEGLEGWPLMRVNAYRNPPAISGTGVINTRAWRAAELPSTNGHGNARAVARLYSALAGDGSVAGVHILSPETIARATTEQVYGEDIVLQRPTRFGLGFQLTMAERRLGPGPRAFGHFGAGGSLGFADPDARVAFGYAMNQGRGGWQHEHVRRLIDLVYEALGSRRAAQMTAAPPAGPGGEPVRGGDDPGVRHDRGLDHEVGVGPNRGVDDVRRWIDARRAAARREAADERATGPRPRWAVASVMALIALTGRLHGWPVPETAADRREDALVHQQWGRLRRALRPDVEPR